MADFSLSIRKWYRQNGRNLPWRETSDPYFIWLSEVILQQTRVDQGLDYYYKFIRNYPTIHELAAADEQAVLNDWQGLGYYSRARNLRSTARLIATELNGTFPQTYDELIKLKGIGPYSAAAISSFAFGEKRAVVDGNVFRVLSRYFEISEPIDTTQGKRIFTDLANELISAKQPGEHNQALMEIGALICTPKNPSCSKCPLMDTCLSHSKHTQLEFPVKSKKTKTRDRYFHYLVFREGEHIILQQRLAKDIWQNMFEFPLLETNSMELNPEIPLPEFTTPIFKHVLSHQKIYARFHVYSQLPEKMNENWRKFEIADLSNLPLPRLIDKFLEEHL